MSANPYDTYIQNHPDFAMKLENARARSRLAIARVQNTTSRSSRRYLINKVLRSEDAKLFFMFKSVIACKLLGTYSPARISLEADSLDLFGTETEEIRELNLPETLFRRQRKVFAFGPRRKARQLLVRDILVAIHQPHSGQFLIRRGVAKALETLEQDFRDGFHYAIERDIRRFYEHVRLEGIARLLNPLPIRVTENVVWEGRSDNRTDDDISIADITGMASLGGLPQGSASSPIAAEIVVATLIRDMPTNVRVRTYADNIIVLGRTYHDALAGSSKLETLAGAHSAGPLRLKPNKTVIDLKRESISVLGYDGMYYPSYQRYLIAGNALHTARIDWSPKHEKLSTIEDLVMSPSTSTDALVSALKWCSSSASYSLWTDGASWALEAQCFILSRLAYHSAGRLRLVLCQAILRVWKSNQIVFPELKMLLIDPHPAEENGEQIVRSILKKLDEVNYP